MLNVNKVIVLSICFIYITDIYKRDQLQAHYKSVFFAHQLPKVRLSCLEHLTAKGSSYFYIQDS